MWYKERAERLCEAAVDANRMDVEKARYEMAQESAQKTQEIVAAIDAQYAENRQPLIEYFSTQIKHRDNVVESCGYTQDLMRREVMELSNERSRQTRTMWENANEVMELRAHFAEAIIQEKKASEIGQNEIMHIQSIMNSEQGQWKSPS